MTESHQDLPAPLVPPNVDLRDFQYMELDVQKLRDSRFAAEVDAEAFRAGILLWCAAWHQVPAGSLPDNDVELSNLAGFGRVVREWKRVREQALSLFVRCSDGRLYHPVIAEKAVAAWDSKQRHQYDKLCDRLRKENKKRADNDQPAVGIPTFDQWKSGGTEPDFPPESLFGSGGIPAVNALRGNGEGTEQNGDLRDKTLTGPVAGLPTIPCPYQAIVDLYHAKLPLLPRCRLMPKSRQAALRKVWGWVLSSTKTDGTRRATTAEEAMTWLGGYFDRASENDFLMGRTQRNPLHANWRCDLDYLLTDRGMKQVIEKTQERAA